jgi:pimeloyl-ACP methyl ester carboxylesterase
MGIINRGNLSDLRGVIRLAVEATVGVTDVVEKMHHTIQLAHPPLGTSKAGNTRGLTGIVYRSIRGTTRLVGHGLDAGLTPFMTLLPEEPSTSTRDAFVSAINGINGDHLVQTDNPLAIDMGFRCAGLPLDPAKPDTVLETLGQTARTGKIMLFVHGLCLNDGHWTRDGHNHGRELATDIGYTPVYLRYNTGLPVAVNGRELAGLLEQLVKSWPHPVSEIAIVGHSMGGLVARSACHEGRLAGLDWLRCLNRLVSIGTPHQGAPLERGGNWLDYALDMSPYAAPFTRIGKKRSAGITDLRHGSVTEDQMGFVPLPAGVECYAMAATLAKKRTVVSERLIGDGLVPLDSALGQSKNPGRDLLFPARRQWVANETGHIELLGHPGLYEQLRAWFE